jgi:hypothetical protein
VEGRTYLNLIQENMAGGRRRPCDMPTRKAVFCFLFLWHSNRATHFEQVLRVQVDCSPHMHICI